LDLGRLNLGFACLNLGFACLKLCLSRISGRFASLIRKSFYIDTPEKRAKDDNNS
jgi:hypothetical protein